MAIKRPKRRIMKDSLTWRRLFGDPQFVEGEELTDSMSLAPRQEKDGQKNIRKDANGPNKTEDLNSRSLRSIKREAEIFTKQDQDTFILDDVIDTSVDIHLIYNGVEYQVYPSGTNAVKWEGAFGFDEGEFIMIRYFAKVNGS